MSLDYSQFEKMADELANEFPIFALSSARKAMTEMSDFLLGQVPEYPVETLEKLMPPDGVSFLRTDQQRRWFFAAVQSGEIPGWEWIDARYEIYYRRITKGKFGTYKLKGEQIDDQGNRFVTEQAKRLIEVGHPQKIGGSRTGNLGRSAGRDISSTDQSVIAILGFDSAIAPYAPWVVGDDFPGENDMYQARVHVDRWWQFRDIIEANIDEAWKLFDKVFWEEFSKRVNVNK